MTNALNPRLGDSIDTGTEEVPRPASRRAILAAGMGSMVGFVASALGRPPAVRAGSDGDVVLGDAANATSTTTKITVTTASVDALWVVESGSAGRALRGTANGSAGNGVFGESTGGTGVRGSTSNGHGVSGDADAGIGVYGSSLHAVGVAGHSDGTSAGVSGFCGTGTGTEGTSTSGIGLEGTVLNAGGPGVLGHSQGNCIGVVGWSSDSQGVAPDNHLQTGVFGYEVADGVGVRGETGGATGGGTGVLGISNSPDGFGLSGVGNNGGTGIKGDGRVGVFASSTTDGWMAVWGRHFGAGYGVAGDSITLTGVSGTSNATDHAATVGKSQGNSTGLLGFSGAQGDALPSARAKTGVFGKATQDSSSRGVVGASTTGTGVRGEATSGAAVLGVASSKAGYGVRSSGRVRFDKVSGVATIPANATTVVVTPGTDVTSESFVLLTAKTNIASRSLSFSTDTSGDTFTIRISASRSTSTSVAWLLLN